MSGCCSPFLPTRVACQGCEDAEQVFTSLEQKLRELCVKLTCWCPASHPQQRRSVTELESAPFQVLVICYLHILCPQTYLRNKKCLTLAWHLAYLLTVQCSKCQTCINKYSSHRIINIRSQCQGLDTGIQTCNTHTLHTHLPSRIYTKLATLHVRINFYKLLRLTFQSLF